MATQLGPGKIQFTDGNGKPYAGGSVYFYIPATTTLKNTWQDAAQTVLNTNPVILDGDGRAIIFGSGAYRQQLYDANSNLVWDQLTYSPATDAVGPSILAQLVDTTDPANGDALIGVKQPFTGAVGTTQHEYNAERYSVFNAMTPAQIADVQAGTFTQDVTAAINVAISAAAILGKRLFVPAGLYKIVPATGVTSEAGAETVAFPMTSNMAIEAEPGAIFKLADNQSTDASPKALEMFFTNQVLSKVSIRGLTMDMNGANNHISPGRPTVYNVSNNMAMICVSGTPSGVAARIDDMVIENCTFQNTPGVCCIVAAQSNTVGVTLGSRWTIRNNLFLNNGTDTNDHTSIFAWVNDVLCDGNIFWQSNPYATVGLTGGVTAYEVHGSSHRFVNNYVQNYFRGMWVGPNLTSILDNTVISSNVFVCNFYGVDFFRFAANQTASRNTLIVGNIFNLDDTTFTGAPPQKSVINIAPSYTVNDIKIADNIALKTGTAISSVFVTVAPGTVAANPLGRIIVNGNKASGFCFGVGAFCNATNGIGYLAIEGNSWTDFRPAGITAISAGSFINGSSTSITSLVIGKNDAIDSTASGLFQYGYYVQGNVTDFYLGAQVYEGMALGNYFENSATVTNRFGFFSDIAFVPVVTAGASTMTLGNGSIACSYSLLNDIVEMDFKLTVGSTTSFGAGGNINVTVPYNAKTSGKTYLGSWRIFDGTVFTQGVSAIDGTTNIISMSVNGAGLVSSSAPVSLSTGRTVTIQIMYRKA